MEPANPILPAPVSSARRRWARGLGVCLVVLLACVTGWQWYPAPRVAREESASPETALPEVERPDLALKAGRLHLGDRLFTGQMLEHYPDGVLKSRSAVSNGLLHGLSEGWFTNQVQQVAEHFVNGVSHGERLRWDEQGRKLAAAQIVHGKIEGVFRRWHTNGVLSEEVTMKNGEAEGLSRAWYPSRCLQAEITMAQGKVLVQRRYPDGERPPTAEPLAQTGKP